jgi:heme-degrading monooxygenase HmoA
VTPPKLVLLVRLESRLPSEQVRSVMEERAPEFRALEGLRQKYYLQDAKTGEYAGLYLWDSAEALDAYRESELRASIAEAYQAEGAPKIEVYRVMEALRNEGE